MLASQLLSATGPFAQFIAGFAPRLAQQQMAEAVEQLLQNDGGLTEPRILVVEAGTGTGKTFGYLVPALLSGQRLLISTGTKHLQDQLFHRDLPTVQRALSTHRQAVLLKGRSNYLCLQRFERVMLGDQRFAQVRTWAEVTQHGDLAELDVPENWSLRGEITANSENCLGGECPRLRDCFAFKARRAALEADIVVINHHLFFADLALKEDGFGELLPVVDGVIFDEAHQLPALASQFLSVTVSSRQLLELQRDSLAEQRRELPEWVDFVPLCDAFLPSLQRFTEALGEDGRVSWDTVKPWAHPVAQEIDHWLKGLIEALEGVKERSKGLASCWQRAGVIRGRWRQVTQLEVDENIEKIGWVERRGGSFLLSLTPLEIAAVFTSLTQQKAWIFTSATLTVKNDFDHFTQRLGLTTARTLRLDSPFDYANLALAYLPKGLPEPSVYRFNRELMQHIKPILRACGGRAMILFTSYSALNEAERFLSDLPFPLLCQGSRPRTVLLDEFRNGGGVLLATASFWEGVDVRGEALSCVVIAKLPFASPDDPVLTARSNALKQQKRNPFNELQVPHAVIALKQGVGRLIRDVTDRGVLVLGDPRLLTKPYGRTFLDSLPPMRRTREIDEVLAFLRVTS